ncbi:MAG: ABC transporter ATP-binding protein [Coriobacteriia bacterium]|nr:ABC transporter ATP-binding protein [Coriobacteriia bacterium]
MSDTVTLNNPAGVATDAPALLIEHARKDYGRAAGGRRDAVADVSLRVSRGAIHGLLGPNGAGKTTTLKMLLGLVKPSGGRFEILGLEARKPGARARVGFLPEQPYFPQQLTASEAMALYGRLAGLSRAEIAEQTGDLLERVGLEGRQKTILAKFSRGMLQRLGLAQALLGQPEVLVLDEPASGLDPIGQRDVRNLMVSLKEGGATILLSSHQLSEVETISDEVTILHQGRVAARGHIDDLLNVSGQTSLRVLGVGDLPAAVAAVVCDIAISGTTTVFSLPDEHVRRVIEQLYDGGWKIVSLQPKRASLEDYFAALLVAAEKNAPHDAASKGGRDE